MLDAVFIAVASLSVLFGLIVHVITLIRARRSSDPPLLTKLDTAIKNSEEKILQAERVLEEYPQVSRTNLVTDLRRISRATDDELIDARKALDPHERKCICQIARLWRDLGFPRIKGRRVLFSHYCRYTEWRHSKIYIDDIYSVIRDYFKSDTHGVKPRHFVLHTPHDGPSVLLAADASDDKDAHALVLWAHLPVANGNGAFAASDGLVPNCQVFCQVYARKKDPLSVVPITFQFAPHHRETNRDTYLIYEDRPTEPKLVKNHERNLHGFSHAVRVSYSPQALICIELALGIDRNKWVAEPDDSAEESDQQRQEFFEYLESQLRPTFEQIVPGVERVRQNSKRHTKNLDEFFDTVVRQASYQTYHDITLFKKEGVCQITELAGLF